MKLIEKIIEEKMIKCNNGDENGELNDVVDVLLKQMKDDDDDDDQNITIDFICSNITEMMIPGEDSVPMLITLALKFLGDSPSLNQLKVCIHMSFTIYFFILIFINLIIMVIGREYGAQNEEKIFRRILFLERLYVFVFHSKRNHLTLIYI